MRFSYFILFSESKRAKSIERNGNSSEAVERVTRKHQSQGSYMEPNRIVVPWPKPESPFFTGFYSPFSTACVIFCCTIQPIVHSIIILERPILKLS